MLYTGTMSYKLRLTLAPEGHWVPRVIEGGKVRARCSGHRHWTKITAKACGRNLLSGLSRTETTTTKETSNE